MKFKINKKTLNEALKYITNIIGPFNVNPILSNILVNVEKKIVLNATNGVVSSKYEINDGFTIESIGSFLVKGKILYSIISKINENEIEIELIDSSIIRISTQTYSCDVNLTDDSSFPSIDFNVEQWEKFSLPGKLIKETIEKVAPSASTSTNGMTVLHGVLFDSSRIDGEIEIIASDSFKLSYLKNEYMGPKFKFVIRTENLKQIYDQVNDKLNIDFYIKNKNLIINVGNVWLSCSLFENEFPSATKFIEQKREYNFQINKNILLNALERGLTFVNAEKRPSVLFDVKNDFLALNFRSVEFGSSYEEIPIVSNKPINFSFNLNVRYLSELLKLISSDEVAFEIEGINKAIIIKNKNNENYCSLLLPIKSN